MVSSIYSCIVFGKCNHVFYHRSLGRVVTGYNTTGDYIILKNIQWMLLKDLHYLRTTWGYWIHTPTLGNVQVGNYVEIGPNATIHNRIDIGEDTEGIAY